MNGVDDDEQLVAVVYHQTGDVWYPHSIQTRNSTGGVRYYDANYSREHGAVFVHLSGFGGDGKGGYDVDVGPYAEPSLMPGRIWLHDDAVLSIYRGKKRVAVKRSRLAAMGYLILDKLPGDPFADAVEGETLWCDTCDDFVSYEDTFECAMCCEQAHGHGLGRCFVVVDEREATIPIGLYKVTRCPFYTSSLLGGGWIDEHAVQRVGPVPDRVQTHGHPCAWVCDACRDSIIAPPQERANEQGTSLLKIEDA